MIIKKVMNHLPDGTVHITRDVDDELLKRGALLREYIVESVTIDRKKSCATVQLVNYEDTTVKMLEVVCTDVDGLPIGTITIPDSLYLPEKHCFVDNKEVIMTETFEEVPLPEHAKTMRASAVAEKRLPKEINEMLRNAGITANTQTFRCKI